jgi:hypothetical protein
VFSPFSKFCAFVVRLARQTRCAQVLHWNAIGAERQASGEPRACWPSSVHKNLLSWPAGALERCGQRTLAHLAKQRSWCGGRGVPRRCRPCTGTRARSGGLRYSRSSTLPPLDLGVNATRRGSLARVGHRSPIEGRCCRAPVLGPAPWRLPPLIPISPAAAARLGKEKEQTQQAPACQRHEHEGAVREQRASDLAGGQGLMAECMVGAAGHRAGRLGAGSGWMD